MKKQTTRQRRQRRIAPDLSIEDALRGYSLIMGIPLEDLTEEQRQQALFIASYKASDNPTDPPDMRTRAKYEIKLTRIFTRYFKDQKKRVINEIKREVGL